MANLNLAFQPEGGINFDDLVGIFAGTADPSVGGEAAPIGSLYLRSTGLLYQKTSAPDTGWTVFGGGGTVTSVNLTQPAAGITVSGGPITTSGSITLALANDLAALEASSGTGFAARTAADTWALRVLTGTASRLSITNTAGVAGNPVFDIDAAYVGQTSITTLGTVTTGTWNATSIAVAQGGTGLTAIGTANQMLGVNAAGSALEYKTFTGTGITISHSAGGINFATVNNGTVTSVAATGSTGLTVGGSPITSSGTITLTLGTELQGLSGLATTGLVTRTGAGTYVGRTITAGTGISVANGDGSAANPIITNTGVTSAIGTTNQVNVSAATGDVTFSLPQNIHSGATPSFAQVAVAADPSTALQVATKQYVDNAISGLDVKQSVRVASTANIATLSGLLTVDGVTVVAGDRVLVKDQTTASQNGIYVAAAGAWARSTDADINAEVTAGLYTFVTEGTTNADSGWVLTSNDPIIVGTTALPFVQFTGAGQVTAGAGLTKTGNTLDVVGTAGRIVANADSIDLATAGTAGTYATVTTDAYGRVTSGSSTQSTGTGGTGLTAIGTANQVLGVNAGATALEYKTLAAGANITITPTAGVLTIAATGGSGTPGGATTNVQFNNAGAFGGTSNFNYVAGTNPQVNILGTSATTQLVIGSNTPTSTNVTTGSNNSTVFIQVDGNASSEGLRVYFKRSTAGISGWITYDYDQNAPNIRLTDEDDDPPYIQFNTIGTGTYLLPQFTSLFGARGPVAGRTTGFEWKIGTATANWGAATTIMTLDSQYLKIPTGTTAQRPGSPTAGMMRFNTSLKRSEEYNGSTWAPTGGLVLQMVTGTIAAGSGTTTVPLDNTAPTNTEGWQIWTQSFTPISATSRITVEFTITTSHSIATGTNICSVFAGSTNIGCAASRTDSAANTAACISVQVIHTPGSTAAITFSARLGNPTAGTSYCNQIGTTTLGGALVTQYTITEVQ